MIPFLRKLRKQLADDNNALKYMRYAIGEIVLVVIGILIALSINNWNQERHQKIKEKKILIELNRDLAFNINILHHEIEMQTQHLNEILTTIEYLKSKKPFNDSIGMYINHASWIERIQFNTSTYESLKTIGLDIITNDSIKTDIAYLFGNEFPQKTMWIRDAGMAYANFALPYFVKFFESDGNKGGINIPVDYEALLNNQEFINVLSRKRGLKTVITLRLEELLAYVEKTRARITKELETFD